VNERCEQAARGTAGGGARCSVVGSGSRRAAFGAADVAIAACGTPLVAATREWGGVWLSGVVGLRHCVPRAAAHPSLPAAPPHAAAPTGTINLELAAAGVPQVAVYSTSWLTGFVIRRDTPLHCGRP
jgi:lipid-A-disaccharide synthase